jgi:hypothetical protein
VQAVNYSHQLRGYVCESLDVAWEQDLPAQIPLSHLDLLQGRGANFVLGRSEADIFLQAWLAHKLVGSTEMAVTTMDGNWLGIIKSFCDAIVYRDETHGSSVQNTRPDGTVCVNGAVILKHEAKARRSDLDSAVDELREKMFVDALRMFPRGSTSIIGVVSCDEAVELYRIDHADNKFYTRRLKYYALDDINGRIAFLVDIVKLCRWFIGIEGPNEKFHLIPNHRAETPNRHFITWCVLGLQKEFRKRSVTTENMDRIHQVHSLRLHNIEWGISS